MRGMQDVSTGISDPLYVCVYVYVGRSVRIIITPTYRYPRYVRRADESITTIKFILKKK